MLTDFEPEDESQESKEDFSEQFIEDYIRTQKARLETRKLIQEMLFFVSCQVASASLAMVLFQFAVQVVFTTWLCLFIAWIPSLSSLCEVNFNKTSDGWELRIMNRPLIAIIKFVTAVGIVTVSIQSVHQEILATNQAILDVYEEIQKYETPQPQNFLPPFTLQAFLAAIGIVLLVSFVKGWRDRSPF